VVCKSVVAPGRVSGKLFQSRGEYPGSFFKAGESIREAFSKRVPLPRTISEGFLVCKSVEDYIGRQGSLYHHTEKNDNPPPKSTLFLRMESKTV
jgi:hypothetical protein